MNVDSVVKLGEDWVDLCQDFAFNVCDYICMDIRHNNNYVRTYVNDEFIYKVWINNPWHNSFNSSCKSNIKYQRQVSHSLSATPLLRTTPVATSSL